MSGRLIRTEAEAAAVPPWSVVQSEGGGWWTVGRMGRPDGALVGDTLTHVAVPVEVLQRHEDEVAVDGAFLRQRGLHGFDRRRLARRRELWPEVLAAKPVESIEDVARRVQAAEVPDPDDARRLAAAVIGEGS